MLAEGLKVDSPDEQVVRETLRSILDSPQFSKSKRYPAFLEYVVLCTLEGNDALLKERTLATEVFGRSADYDSSSDTVVRVAAGEVRRRLAQYFNEHPDAPVRIDLPVGSYTAEFRFSTRATEINLARHAETSPGAEFTAPANLSPSLPRKEKSRLPLYLALAIALFIAGGIGWRRYQKRSAAGDVWQALLQSDRAAKIVTGRYAVHPPPGADEQHWSPLYSNVSARSAISLEDAMVLARVCSILREHNHDCTISPASMETLEGLAGNSLVLIGGLNNEWTIKLLAPLRFHLGFASADLRDTPTNRVILEHNGNQDSPKWVVQNGLDPQASTDYGIVARFHSEITDSMVVVIAGLHPETTKAAGDFLLSQQDTTRLLAMAPKGWKGTDFEAVLKTEIIKGTPGHATIIATQFW